MSIWRSLTSRGHGKGRPRVAILGLDGTPHSLANRFIQDGTMPNLAQIAREGTLAAMETSIPDISSVAWTTFFTGVNPAKHGVFGFLDLKPHSYEMYFPNSHNIRSKTLWDHLGAHGKRSVVLNVPSTYPAKPLHGSLVSGFVAIELEKATYPASLLPLLRQANYQLDVDATIARESLARFADELTKCLDAREKVLWQLLTNEEWDLFVGVITETDRMQHYFWDAIEEPTHEFHDFFKATYRRIDQFLGKVYEWFRGKGTFMLMSDHGFCKIRHEIYLNAWLKAEGYVKFSTPEPRSFEDLDPSTTAFTLDPARIYIHTEKRYPRGRVAAGRDYERLREELKTRLLALQVDGRPVIQRAFDKEELYEGPLMDVAPDLILLPHWGFDLKGAINKPSFIGNSALTGMHTQNDALFFINAKLQPNGHVNILNLTPTAIKALGVDPGDGFDTPPLL